MMDMADSPLRELQTRLIRRETRVEEVSQTALSHANSNASHNTYIALSSSWTMQQAEAQSNRTSGRSVLPELHGIPVSLKDCFDLCGFPTSCGSKYYEQLHGLANADSAIAARIQSKGGIITGKTHLHQLAYGITGENPEYGACVQPRNPQWLTGGSSSGAAASVQEGSALVAIGTDTGGSIRVPAALCGLAGYRSSLGVGSWDGGAHLAPSFDTLGFICRDLRDTPAFAHSLLDIGIHTEAITNPRIGTVSPMFLHDCESSIHEMYERCQTDLGVHGAKLQSFDSSFWDQAMDIFAPIQAHEAAALHHGRFQHFESSIAERLAWGESISGPELTRLRQLAQSFNARMDILFDEFDFLIVPCAPVSVLLADADHSTARQRILRYTTPMSLAGLPVVTLPFARGGVQLIAQRGKDAELLSYAAQLGEHLMRGEMSG